MPVSERGISGDREFPSTSWSLILRIQDATSAERSRHMTQLIEKYWRPVYWVARHVWDRSHDDAKDFTQEFFATVVVDRDIINKLPPDQRSFRAFLRTALTRFMLDGVRSTGRQKRGSGQVISSLDTVAEAGPAPALEGVNRTPEEVFDSTWRDVVIMQAVERLETRLAAEGRPTAFELFKQYDLEGDSTQMSYADVGRQFSMNAQQVNHALRQARHAFREIILEIVSTYVDDPTQLKAEVKALFGP